VRRVDPGIPPIQGVPPSPPGLYGHGMYPRDPVWVVPPSPYPSGRCPVYLQPPRSSIRARWESFVQWKGKYQYLGW
jgi:hypothetical protein